MFQTTYLLQRFDKATPNELLRLCVLYSEFLSNDVVLEVKNRLNFFETTISTDTQTRTCEQLEMEILGKLGELENRILET